MQIWIDRFTRYLSVERNLSPHTRAAYLRDLNEFKCFLERHGGSSREHISRLDSFMLRRYLAELHKDNQRTSIARKLSSLRTFFRFLVREGLLAGNPAEGLSTPKLNRYLPKTLSVDEAKALMERGYDQSLLALRDRAIMELFYSCGLARDARRGSCPSEARPTRLCWPTWNIEECLERKSHCSSMPVVVA
jgi:integrase/recombinase XerC